MPLFKKLNYKVCLLLLGFLFVRIVMFMTTPFLAVYLSSKNFSPIEIGYIISVNPLSNVIVCLFSGYFVSKISPRISIGIIPIIWGGIFFGFYFSSTFIEFLILNMLNGISYSIFEPALKRSLSMLSSSENKLLVFNLRYTAINVGALLGPMLSIVYKTQTTLFPYLILGIVYVVYGITNFCIFSSLQISNTAIKKNYTFINAISDLFSDKFFTHLIIGMTICYIGYSQFTSTISEYLAKDFIKDGINFYSMLLTLNAITVLALQYPILNALKRINSYVVMILSNIFIATGLLLFGLSTIKCVLALAIIIFSIGELLIGSRLDVLLDELSNSNPSLAGLYFSGAEIIKIGKFFGPIISGYLISYFTFNSHIIIFLLLSLITLTGIINYIYLISISKSNIWH